MIDSQTLDNRSAGVHQPTPTRLDRLLILAGELPASHVLAACGPAATADALEIAIDHFLSNEQDAPRPAIIGRTNTSGQGWQIARRLAEKRRWAAIDLERATAAKAALDTLLAPVSHGLFSRLAGVTS